MPLARTLNPKKLVIACKQDQFLRLVAKHRWDSRECQWVRKEDDLRGYRLAPVANCELIVVGNHPVMGTAEFRRLVAEKGQ